MSPSERKTFQTKGIEKCHLAGRRVKANKSNELEHFILFYVHVRALLSLHQWSFENAEFYLILLSEQAGWETVNFKFNVMRIIYIDDDSDDREFFSDAIKIINPQISCIPFDNTEDSLAYLKKNDLTVDFIFVDLNMPKM